MTIAREWVLGDDGRMALRRVITALLGDAPAPPQQVQGGDGDRLGAAWRTLDLVNTWVVHAEAKLGVTLAYLGALFAGLVAMSSSYKSPSCVILGLTALAVVLLFVGVFFAALGILPRFKKSPDGVSAIYYSDIAVLESPAEYVRRFDSVVCANDLERHVLEQAYWNSRVAVKKFACAHRSIRFGVLALGVTGFIGLGLLLGW